MALGSIGGISVKITADVDSFITDMDEAQARIAKAGTQLRKGVNDYGKWAAAGVAAATAVASAMVRSQMQTIDALGKTADRLGLTTEALAGLQRSAELSGAGADTLNMALQRMTRRVAEAAQGTGEAKNAIAELGLDAQKLAAMSPDEQFKTIADAMGDVAEQGDKVRLAMRLFDSEGVKLVNTLAMGSDALREQERVAQALGVALNRVDTAKVENANDAMFSAGQAIEGVVNRVAVQLAPVIEAIANEFTNAAIDANGFSDTIDAVMRGAARVVGVFADGLHGIHVIYKGLEVAGNAMGIVVLESMRVMTVGIEQFVNTAISGINEIIDAANWFGAGLEPIEKWTFGAATMFTDLSNSAKDSLGGAMDELHNLAMQPIPSQQIDEWLTNVQAAAQKAAEAMVGATGGETSEGGTGGLGEQQKAALQARIDAVRESLMTERELMAENYLLEQEALKQALENKMLTQAEYDALAKEKAQQHANEILAIEQNKAKAEQEIEKRKNQAKLAALGGIFSNLSSLMNTESRKLFEVGKAAAVASAVVDGYAAVQKTMASVPYPLNIPLAAAQAVASAAQVKGIMSTKFGSAGTGQSMVGGQVATNTAPVQQAQPQQNISIALTGSSFTGGDIRALIGQINEELGDGVTLSATGG